MVLTSSGINDGVQKFVAEHRDSNWTNNVFKYYTRAGALLFCVSAGLLILTNISSLTARYLGEEFEAYLYILIFLILGTQMNSVARNTLRAHGRERISEPVDIVEKVILYVGGIFLVSIGWGVVGVLVSHCVAVFVAAFILLYHLSDLADLTVPFQYSSSSLPKRELTSFAVYNTILLLLMTSLYQADILLLRLLTDRSSVGYYKSALLIAEMLWFVPKALHTALLHSSSEIWSTKNTAAITDVSSKAVRYTLLITLLLIIGLSSLADVFIPTYYGADFEPAVLPLLLLLPGSLGFAIVRPILAIIQGAGRIRLLIVGTGVSASVNIGLNLVLIPSYGIAGAAVATSIGYGSMILTHSGIAYRLGVNPFKDVRILRVAVTGILSAIPIYAISYILGDSISALVIVPPVGLLFYSIFSVRTGAISPEEITTILDSLPEPYSKKMSHILRYLESNK